MKAEPLFLAERDLRDGRPIFTTPLTMLDYFAGLALAGGFGAALQTGFDNATIAKGAYSMAESMLIERARRQQGGEK